MEPLVFAAHWTVRQSDDVLLGGCRGVCDQPAASGIQTVFSRLYDGMTKNNIWGVNTENPAEKIQKEFFFFFFCRNLHEDVSFFLKVTFSGPPALTSSSR